MSVYKVSENLFEIFKKSFIKIHKSNPECGCQNLYVYLIAHAYGLPL